VGRGQNKLVKGFDDYRLPPNTTILYVGIVVAIAVSWSE